MNVTINLIKNNFRRITTNRAYLFLSLGIIFALVSMAVFVTANFEVKGNIAYVTKSGILPAGLHSLPLHVTALQTAPPFSELVMNKYDAVVLDKGNGQLDIRTIKNNQFKQTLSALLTTGKAPTAVKSDERHVGSNIMGYLLMFLMLQGLFFMFFFTEDKEKRCFKRILCSPASVVSYLTAQFVFNFLLVYLPTLLVLTASMSLFHINSGLSYLQYAYLTGILALFSSGFALLLTSAIEKSDNVMTFASSFVVLTSILSGSFGTLSLGNGIAGRLIGLLPQKSYLTLVQGLENGGTCREFLPQLAYLLILIALMTLTGAWICRKRFHDGRY